MVITVQTWDWDLSRYEGFAVWELRSWKCLIAMGLNFVRGVEVGFEGLWYEGSGAGGL